MHNGSLIQRLEGMVIRAEQNSYLGPCFGFESYGLADGQNIVPCSRPATIHLIAEEIELCEKCLQRGSY